ncbi:cyclophilin-like fold protein [Pararhizobium sp. PWRC1-1]|uniref:cyclophilin-like fold protein n=1 Tax=Pararhizobium sp. PWRC1-1 TaxID=2804566 RepID=UPI003CF54E0C
MVRLAPDRLLLPAGLAALLLLSLGYWWLDNGPHEIFGTVMFGLLAWHLYANRRWFLKLGTGSYDARRWAVVLRHSWLPINMTVLLVTSVLISRSVLSFIQFTDNVGVIELHWFRLLGGAHHRRPCRQPLGPCDGGGRDSVQALSVADQGRRAQARFRDPADPWRLEFRCSRRPDETDVRLQFGFLGFHNLGNAVLRALDSGHCWCRRVLTLFDGRFEVSRKASFSVRQWWHMKKHAGTVFIAASLTLLFGGSALAQDRISISSDWGNITAELADNAAARAFAGMLPLTIDMDDHRRQEKTGDLPAALPSAPRQRQFSTGTLGLWSSGDFVIYYRDGHVPSPGIVILGEVQGDVSIFARPGKVTIKIASE